MELFLYLSIYIFSVFFAIKPNFVSERNFIFLWFGTLTLLSYFIRSDEVLMPFGNVNDIQFYMHRFATEDFWLVKSKGDEGGFVFYWHYLKEWFFWLVARLLFNLTGSYYAVFYIFDTLCAFIIYSAFNKLRYFYAKEISKESIRYILFGFLLFFPVVAGFQSFYRQYFATVLLIYSISFLIHKKYFQNIFVYILSLFTHNAVFVFLPMIFVLKEKKSILLSVISFLLIPVITIFLPKYNDTIVWSSLEIGRRIEYFYLIFILGIGYYCFTQVKQNNNLRLFFFSLMMVYILIVFTFASEASVRFAYLFLMLLYPLIGYLIEQKDNSKLVKRLALINISIIPLLILDFGHHIYQ